MKVDFDLNSLRVVSFETLPELRAEEERMVVGGSSCCSTCTCETGDTVVIVADPLPPADPPARTETTNNYPGYLTEANCTG